MFRLICLALLLAGCVAYTEPPTADQGRIQPDPTSYTIGFVDTAISFYKTHGLEETVAYFSSEESRLDQWYVFIVDGESGKTIAHPDPSMIGYDTAGGVDVVGKLYGPDIMSADENGKWVDYVWESPITGKLHQKHAWIIRHDGLLFGSGWYEEEEFKQQE